MLPLTAAKIPVTPAELAAALTAGFAAQAIATREVCAEGSALDALDLLRLDLSGAKGARGLRVPQVPAEGPIAVMARHLKIVGQPVEFESFPLHLEITAERVGLRYGGLPGDGALALATAESGHIVVAAQIAEIEALLRRLAAGPAEKQGVDIKRVQLEFTPINPRELTFRCTITAKLFVMSADLALSGHLAIDSQLNARLTGLTLGGDAMVTKLAGGFIRPHLDRLEGRTFPLATFVPTGLPLRDVEISPTAERLTILAKFGRSAS
jgi:hypothetical protein